jgi:uncharacterized surface protein with fasciclin (FAS1) repeats
MQRLRPTLSLLRLRPLYAAALATVILAVPSQPAAGKDLMDTMIGMRSFCAFLGAVRAAGLEGELRGPGPLTLLAPNDDAFAAIPTPVHASLMRPENREQLAATIRRHLLQGSFTARGLVGQRRWAETAAGTPILLDGTTGQLMVGDEIEVLYADVISDNGVLHIIDNVVLPN